MEIMDIYDVDRHVTGRTWVRGSAVAPGELHLVVHACIFNSKGEMLIQQRQSCKAGWPDKWDVTVAGCAVAGDTSAVAIHRELLEELGLDVDFHTMRPKLTIHFEYGFDDIYLFELEPELSELKLQEDEVQAVRWATEAEVMDMIADGSFLPYIPEYISLFFTARKYFGFFSDGT